MFKEYAMQRTLIKVLLIGMLVIWGAKPANAVEAMGTGYYDLGVFAYEDGDYAKALDLLSKALKDNPYDLSLYHYLGKTYLKLDRTDAAEHYLLIVEKTDPQRVGLTYDLAMLYFQKEDYEKALSFFDQLIRTEPENVLAVYHAGVCLYKMQAYSKAITSLSRAAQMNASVKPNADYYIGICYYRLEMNDKAMEKFTEVKLNAVTPVLGANAEKWLSVLETEKQAMKPYYLYAQLGAQYDGNVVLEPIDRDIFAKQSDFAMVGYISGRYNLLNQRNLKGGVGYSHYQTHHSNLSDYDLTGSIGDFYLQYRALPYTFGITYTPSYYWVHENSFLMRHALQPEVTWQVDESNAATLAYTYRRDNYFTDNGRDGHAHIGDLDVLHLLPGNLGYITYGLGYEIYRANRADEEFGRFEARLGLTWRIMDKTRLILTAIYDDKDYDNINPVFNLIRKDDRYYGSISINRDIFYDWLSLSLEYSYTHNDSNIDYYEYRRNAVLLSVCANL